MKRDISNFQHSQVDAKHGVSFFRLEPPFFDEDPTGSWMFRKAFIESLGQDDELLCSEAELAFLKHVRVSGLVSAYLTCDREVVSSYSQDQICREFLAFVQGENKPLDISEL